MASPRTRFCETDSGRARGATQLSQLEQHREHAFQFSVEMNLVAGEAFEPVGIDGFAKGLSAKQWAIVQLLPSLTIGPLLDSHKHDVDAIMPESLDTEAMALGLYRELLQCAEGRSVIIEEYARQMVYAEELHASEVDKMLRKPGEVAAFRPFRGAA
jgi:hypothetical protein